MRTILVDWLVDVHLKFKLQPETLFLAIECIDRCYSVTLLVIFMICPLFFSRFLEKKMVSRQKLQLVGVVGMLLAAKYEEIYPPEVKDFIYIAANTYSREDILRMERLMFSTLDFKRPVALCCAHRIQESRNPLMIFLGLNSFTSNHHVFCMEFLPKMKWNNDPN